MASGDTLHLLLPERRRLAGALSPDIAARFGRADPLPPADEGATAQLRRHFRCTPHGWPLAAIARQATRGDAGDAAWLRADPAYQRAEMSGVRLMGSGALGLDEAGAEALLSALRPVFGDAGFALDATDPGRWYLRMPRGTPLPDFAPPDDALGADVFAFQPQGPEGRRWRALANDAQVTLHHHPLNAARIAAGMPPVNALWFWGGGVLPARVECVAAAVLSGEVELRSLASQAGAALAGTASGGVLRDLRHEREWATIEMVLRDAVLPALGTRFGRVVLDFADGAGIVLAPSQRWRFWRKARDPRA
jgi:hypothetical protein